jgi:hypothetical protein
MGKPSFIGFPNLNAGQKHDRAFASQAFWTNFHRILWDLLTLITINETWIHTLISSRDQGKIQGMAIVLPCIKKSSNKVLAYVF